MKHPMTKPGKTVYVFGIYLLLSGLTLVVAPNTLLGIVGISSTTEVWVRVVGVLVGILGYINVQAAIRNIHDYFILTVYARVIVLVFFTVFVILNFVKPIFIIVGIIDFLGAMWTLGALRLNKT